MAFAGTGQRRKSVKLKNFLTNAVRGVKSFVVNKAIGNFNASDLVSNWTSQNTAYNGSNKSEIQALLKKSPFEKAKDRKTSIKETDPPMPITNYGVTKITGEEYVKAFSKIS